ncbi:pentatricopeptide repeat-containing protein [Striga asiatica]|uniref:Pentatricopeptide repeat-containing protein n=1 Tax=Striga asiatica TaxID=4170 RepID=A0A5A7QSR4_STRAF|nr:pentatricopeptide repeat-containing protein [Striga asiatica]
MTPEKISSFLNKCTKTKAFRLGLSLHAAIIKTGNQSDIFMGNHVLNFYAKCGPINSACKMFDEMPHRNLVTWSAMISGYDQSNKPDSALILFGRMQKHFKPNEFVFASAFSSCSSLKDLGLGRQIHAQALKTSYVSVDFVLNSLILMQIKCGMLSDALSALTLCKPESLSLVSYNIAITGLVENDQHAKGIEIFVLMCRRGLVPDQFTFGGLFGDGGPAFDFSVVTQLHCQMAKLGLDRCAFSGNVLIKLYSKFNLLKESENAFRSIEKRDAISWNTAITAFCQFDEHSKALHVFKEMVMENSVSPDKFTFASVLSASASLASLRNGKEIHARLIRTRPDYDIVVQNGLINMYAKSGSLSSANAIFERMGARNLVSWNTIIFAYANHGLAENAIELFRKMTKIMLPDSVTFIGLLTACNHSGLVDVGRSVFDTMNKVYGINPTVEHLCCLVDLLGRAGSVSEARKYMHKYCKSDDAVVLGSLLSACRLHGGLIDGEHIAERLLELGPVTTSPYALLSNLYASSEKWDCVFGARKMLRFSGLKKEAGYSVVEVKGSVEKFTVGDFFAFENG